MLLQSAMMDYHRHIKLASVARAWFLARVCQAMIDISGKIYQHVVKCNQCNEATPIKNAPPGKKYVHCPCNCLLMSKSSSHLIACPRPNCNRIINVTPLMNSSMDSVTPSVLSGCVMRRVCCAHCYRKFLFDSLNTNDTLSRCPHCREISSIGLDCARESGFILMFLGIVSLVIGIAIMVKAHNAAQSNAGMYVAYVVAFLLAYVLFKTSIYRCRIKRSFVED